MISRGLRVVWGSEMAQAVRLERPGSTSCRVGEGWRLAWQEPDGRAGGAGEFWPWGTQWRR